MATKQPNIIQIIENAEDLPALPHTIAKLFKLANDPDVSLYTVSKLIENDAAMSVRVLKTVNSEIYRFNNEIKNVKQAVSILGIKALRNVAFTVAMLDIFPKRHAEAYMNLFKRSLCAAVAADLIAEMRNSSNASEAFLAALLQNIGMFIFTRYMGDRYAQIIEEAQQMGVDLPYVEKEHIKIINAQAGAIISERWNMPRTVNLAIKYQNNLGLARKKGFPKTYTEIIETAYCAGLAADFYCSWNKMVRLNQYKKSFKHLVANDETMAQDILTSIPHLMQDLAGNIDSELGKLPDFENTLKQAEDEMIQKQHFNNKFYAEYRRTLND